MPLQKDLWRVGIAAAPMTSLLSQGALARTQVTWLPDPGPLRFFADPFAVWRDGHLHVFVEIYDYRDRVGSIEVLTYDAQMRLLDRRGVLKEPWHLSYPFLIESEGVLYMLPEAHKSGRLTLYRAEDFPVGWSAVASITVDEIPIDATPVFFQGLWWLFYTPATTRSAKVSALCCAYATTLMGPWTSHSGNPVRLDASSSRPGGTPLVIEGGLHLPVQDCRRTYGGAIRMLSITVLTPDRFEAQAGEAITGPPAFSPFTEGLHTLSAAGAVTLFDVKRVQISPHTVALDAARQWRRALARWR